MVDIRRTIILLAVTLFALEVSAQSTLGTFAQRQTKQLERRKEQIAKELTSAREAYAANPCDSLGKVVFELTKQSEAVEGALVRIANQEQERIRVEEEAARRAELEKQKAAAAAAADSLANASESAAVEPQEQEPAADAPQAESQQSATEQTTTPLNRLSAALSANALIEGEIGVLIEQYRSAHKRASESLLAYGGATNLAKANEHYAAFNNAMSEMTTLGEQVGLRSQELFNDKIQTYISIAEEVGAKYIRAKYENIIKSVDSKHLDKIKNRCSNVDVAMYPHRLRSTIELEIEVAELLGCESAEPLKQTLEEFNTSNTLFAKLQAPAYANTEYYPVKFNKSKAYVPISSLPKMEVPAEGEVFSIELAGYTKLPNSTSVFRNATPLYRETRSDSRTYIYTGLYPTAKSATDDIALLRNAGFKAPKVVAWRNGVRRDDFVAKGSSANAVVYYRIEINGVDSALSREALQAIRQTAPSKEISKFNAADGSLIYSVGNFTKEAEARNLAAAITNADASLSVTVVEFERKK